jgi:hypothetical protein
MANQTCWRCYSKLERRRNRYLYRERINQPGGQRKDMLIVDDHIIANLRFHPVRELETRIGR